MNATNDRDQFAPPRPPGRLRAVALAVMAHSLLIGALTWGVHWKVSSDQPAVEAELWSAAPQQAAPREQLPPAPPPEPTPAPPPEPVRAPPPPPQPPPRQAVPDTREADIALEQRKKRLEEEKKLQQQKLERERKEEDRRERLEQERKERQQKEKAEREKEQREKLTEQKKAEQEKQKKAEQEKQDKLEKQKKLAEDKRKAQAQAQADAKHLEEMRQANLKRMAGLAGATGGENAAGKDKETRGPSGSYGGRVAARVKPNIVYPDAISGNPRAEVEVRTSPDGTIVGTRLVQSSGNKAWDDAVIRALQKTETLPRDVDGRVPSSLVIGFRPQD